MALREFIKGGAGLATITVGQIDLSFHVATATYLDYLINVEKMSPDEAADVWCQENQRVADVES